MIVLGLTGGIGMGKSTTAAMFAARGVAVWDADAAVHALYGKDGAAVPLIAALVPEAVKSGAVDRSVLKEKIRQNPDILEEIEAIVHPLVGAHRSEFVRSQTAKIVLLDVPLLFELGSDALCNYTITVSVPAEVQRARVLSRPGMTESQFELILSKQMPDAEKRARADFVIETLDLETAERQVDEILQQITEA